MQRIPTPTGKSARALPTLLAALIRARALCKAGAKGPIVSVVFIIIIIIIITSL